MDHQIAWVTLGKYLNLTGDTARAVKARRSSGAWADGIQCKDLDGEVWINLAAVERWVYSSMAAGTAIAPAARVVLDPQTVEQLAAAVAKCHVRLPVSFDLWDTKHIAAYLKRSTDTVRRDLVVLPDFPRPIRLPGASQSQALYKARDVVAWAERLSK